MKAIWKGAVIAESNDIVTVEGKSYFPDSSVNKVFIRNSYTHTVSPRKGKAYYYDLEVEGEINHDAAWYYPAPSDEASDIKDRVAFGKGVEVVND